MQPLPGDGVGGANVPRLLKDISSKNDKSAFIDSDKILSYRRLITVYTNFITLVSTRLRELALAALKLSSVAVVFQYLVHDALQSEGL